MQQRTNKSARKRPSRMPTICVYCGSNTGKNEAYVAAARTLGRQMAEAGVGLVYGGGGLGLMGEIARTVLAHNGHVTGIIPEFLSKKERMLKDADELIVVKDMHQRKRLMFDRSDAFVALPGGIGTLEELVEQLTWAQLGRHDKPIVLLECRRLLGATACPLAAHEPRAVHSARHGCAFHHGRSTRGCSAGD
jgi:uncharacterized protein (TIGR00730 family)